MELYNLKKKKENIREWLLMEILDNFQISEKNIKELHKERRERNDGRKLST